MQLMNTCVQILVLMHVDGFSLAVAHSKAATLPIYTGSEAVHSSDTFKGSVKQCLAQLTVHVRIISATVLSSSAISLYITIVS